MSKTAHILALRTASLGDLGFGISGHPDAVARILKDGQAWIGPRPVLEEDEDFVQVIPYVVLRKGEQVLAYRRGEAGGEGRLHGKVSVGVGGHIDLQDVMLWGDGSIDLVSTIREAAKREIDEETCLYLPEGIAWTHVISSAFSPVDRVHIGLVAQVDLADIPCGKTLDPELCMENVEWREPHELVADHLAGKIELESWSHLVLAAFIQSSA